MVRLICSEGLYRLAPAAVLLLLMNVGALLAQTDEPPEQQQLVQEPDDAALVACLLPAQIERYGTQLTIVGQRQRVETSRADCVERGGEVVEEGASAAEPAR